MLFICEFENNSNVFKLCWFIFQKNILNMYSTFVFTCDIYLWAREKKTRFIEPCTKSLKKKKNEKLETCVEKTIKFDLHETNRIKFAWEELFKNRELTVCRVLGMCKFSRSREQFILLGLILFNYQRYSTCHIWTRLM